MAHLAPLTLRDAAKSLRRFVLLDAGPYRLEGGRVGREFMFAAALETDGRIRDTGRTRMMNALES
jgi:hypothetical protein